MNGTPRRGLHLTSLLCLVAPGLATIARAQEWRMYATPAEAGFDAARLDALRKSAEEARSAAVLAVHRGNVLIAWGEIERRFECHSVRKSLVSALVGIHVAAGDVDLDSTVGELGIDDEPPLTEDEKKVALHHLLASRSGIYHAAAKEPADMKRERPKRGSSRPGERFFYNNWDFNTVGVAFERRRS